MNLRTVSLRFDFSKFAVGGLKNSRLVQVPLNVAYEFLELVHLIVVSELLRLVISDDALVFWRFLRLGHL